MNSPKPIPELSEADKARFWSKLDKNGPVPEHCPLIGRCWIWTGGLYSTGYGRFAIRTNGKTRSLLISRVVWTISHGDPGVENILHRCDNPKCANPSHLFLGSHQDNMADMTAKGRSGHGERQHCRRLSAATVLEMRLLYCQGTFPIQELADRFGVSLGTAAFVIQGRTWRREAADNLQNQIDEISRRNMAKHHVRAVQEAKVRVATIRPRCVNETNGRDNGRAKLDDAAVLEIRALFAKGGVNQRELGVRYGVSEQMISNIIRRKNWTHI